MGSIIEKRHLNSDELPRSYVVVDTETTGLDPNRHELVEIAVGAVAGSLIVTIPIIAVGVWLRRRN